VPLSPASRARLLLEVFMLASAPRTHPVATAPGTDSIAEIDLDPEPPFCLRQNLWQVSANETTYRLEPPSGCFRISAKACIRVTSAALFVIAALLSKDIPRVLSFASDDLFIFEFSAD